MNWPNDTTLVVLLRSAICANVALIVISVIGFFTFSAGDEKLRSLFVSLGNRGSEQTGETRSEPSSVIRTVIFAPNGVRQMVTRKVPANRPRYVPLNRYRLTTVSATFGAVLDSTPGRVLSYMQVYVATDLNRCDKPKSEQTRCLLPFGREPSGCLIAASRGWKVEGRTIGSTSIEHRVNGIAASNLRLVEDARESEHPSAGQDAVKHVTNAKDKNSEHAGSTPAGSTIFSTGGASRLDKTNGQMRSSQLSNEDNGRRARPDNLGLTDKAGLRLYRASNVNAGVMCAHDQGRPVRSGKPDSREAGSNPDENSPLC